MKQALAAAPILVLSLLCTKTTIYNAATFYVRGMLLHEHARSLLRIKNRLHRSGTLVLGITRKVER